MAITIKSEKEINDYTEDMYGKRPNGINYIRIKIAPKKNDNELLNDYLVI